MAFDDFSTIKIVETWHASVQLRFEERFVAIHGSRIRILQQLFVSNSGNKEWRDVPTVKEE